MLRTCTLCGQPLTTIPISLVGFVLRHAASFSIKYSVITPRSRFISASRHHCMTVAIRRNEWCLYRFSNFLVNGI